MSAGQLRSRDTPERPRQAPESPPPEEVTHVTRKQRLAEFHVLESLVHLPEGLDLARRGGLVRDDFAPGERRELLSAVLEAGVADSEALLAEVQDERERRLLNRIVESERRDAEILRRQLEDAVRMFARLREDRRTRALKAGGVDDDRLRDFTAILRARHGIGDREEEPPPPEEPQGDFAEPEDF